jgi:hypothetical protein
MRETLAYEAVAYHGDTHGGFVKSSWCSGARQPWEALASRLRRPDVRCLVAHLPGDPDSLLGWAAVDEVTGSVLWVYVRELYGRVRHRGLMTSLLLEMGVDVSRPTPCAYWSPAAAAIASKGAYRIFYAPKLRPQRRKDSDHERPNAAL